MQDNLTECFNRQKGCRLPANLPFCPLRNTRPDMTIRARLLNRVTPRAADVLCVVVVLFYARANGTYQEKPCPHQYSSMNSSNNRVR